MQRTTKVVIGANYGDEGKGLMTNYLASTIKADAVIRFNGGAQAGHTVVESGVKGRRHVFSHFGAGTLAGISTMLSSHFIVNPILLMSETNALSSLGCVYPTLIIDCRAVLTTPYDMMINQEIERIRSQTNQHHGSCGVGINETVVRSEAGLRIAVSDTSAATNKMLRRVQCEWVPNRLQTLGLEYTPQLQQLVQNEGIFTKFLQDVEWMKATHSTSSPLSLKATPNVVFEGAQGLALDQAADGFPHVTRSNTNLTNVLDVCAENEISEIDVCYVTRAYLTRHGAGILPKELPIAPYLGILETTNVTNEFQGNFRYAFLDVDALHKRITKCEQAAVAHSHSGTINNSVAVTCLDQLGITGSYTWGGTTITTLTEYFAESIAQKLQYNQFYASKGPTSNDVRGYIRY